MFDAIAAPLDVALTRESYAKQRAINEDDLVTEWRFDAQRLNEALERISCSQEGADALGAAVIATKIYGAGSKESVAAGKVLNNMLDAEIRLMVSERFNSKWGMV